MHYVGGAWVNSLSYADDMVLLAPTVTALRTLSEVCRSYDEPHDIVYNTTKTVCIQRKSNCSSHIVTQFIDVLFGVILTITQLERKHTVSNSDTLKRLIHVPGYTSSGLAFPMNALDHINVVFRKSAYSFMSRVTASPNIIVTAIVNSDAYQHSALMDMWESMLYV